MRSSPLTSYLKFFERRITVEVSVLEVILSSDAKVLLSLNMIIGY